MSVSPRAYREEDHETWRLILRSHRSVRTTQICDLFIKGVEALGISDDRIPNLDEINERLVQHSGFRGVLVEGLEEGGDFYRMLSHRQFPIGNFIRDRRDLGYTPAPDIVHDLYGHLPFFVDKDYANFCQAFGELACRYLNEPNLFRQFERFFWFTVEFGLIRTPEGIRIFGAGIASSVGECNYALSGKPEIVPFEIDNIRHQEFQIDEMQKKLFCLENQSQLYTCLPELEKKIGTRKDFQ